MICRLAFIKTSKYPKYWNFKRHWLEELHLTQKRVPIGQFHISLNYWMLLFLHFCSKIATLNIFFPSHSSFWFKTYLLWIAKIKYLHVQSLTWNRKSLKIHILSLEEKRTIDRSCPYQFVPHLFVLRLVISLIGYAVQTYFYKSQQISKLLEFQKILIRRIKPCPKNGPNRQLLCLVKLLAAPFSSLLIKNCDTQYFFSSHSSLSF